MLSELNIHDTTCKRCREVFMRCNHQELSAGGFTKNITTFYVCSKSIIKDDKPKPDGMRIIIVNEYPPCWCPYAMEIKMWQEELKHGI